MLFRPSPGWWSLDGREIKVPFQDTQRDYVNAFIKETPRETDLERLELEYGTVKDPSTPGSGPRETFKSRLTNLLRDDCRKELYDSLPKVCSCHLSLNTRRPSLVSAHTTRAVTLITLPCRVTTTPGVR